MKKCSDKEKDGTKYGRKFLTLTALREEAAQGNLMGRGYPY
jgi:hypothetical protein